MVKKTSSQAFTLLLVSTITCHMTAHAESNTLQEADFDPAFIVGNNKSVDVSRFKYSNPVLPGEYNLDVYVNGNWFGKRKMIFQAQSNQKSAVTCFDATALLNYGVKKDILSQSIDFTHGDNRCVSINQWIKNAYDEFDTSNLRLDIYIPQYALQSNAKGYIDPVTWDRGINAGFMSYSATTYLSRSPTSVGRNNLNAFMSLAMGANILGWQLRHNAQVQWSNKDTQAKKSLSYMNNNTYIQKSFPDYRGVITIGDSFTNGEVFDSLSYRGVDFSSDDRMLPNSLQGYAPQIRGIAKTNAKIEVRQRGQLIYQTNVAPGPFEIHDLYPTGFGGNIEVSVIEADGKIQKLAVPYASVVQMLRPGLDRYSITLGELRDNALIHNPRIAQGKYQRGLNNYLTSFTGFQISDNYVSVILGSAFATPIGAVSLDWTHANAKLNNRTVKGQSYRLNYSKLIAPTSTNLTLSAYRYSTEDFYSLLDTSLFNNRISQGMNTAAVDKQRSQFQITLNQSLPDKLGNVYIVGSWSDYWNRSERSKQYQFGYSNNYRELTYGISATHRLFNTVDTASKSDTEYVFSITIPLNIKKTVANLSATASKDSQSIGVTGIVNDRLSYGVSLSKLNHTSTYNVNSSYKTDIATLAASYSYAPSYQQAVLSARGNVLLHTGGLQLGPEQGQTMAIVYAPNAVGAKVNNLSGLRINKSGYAIVPYLIPYRINDVTLDPQDMSDQVELQETTQRIIPYAGSITQLSFATKVGYAIYIDAKRIDHSSLPFAAEVFNSKGDTIGLVGQGSLVYLRSDLKQDQVIVKWGDNPAQQCYITYDFSHKIKQNQTGILMTEAVCQ